MMDWGLFWIVVAAFVGPLIGSAAGVWAAGKLIERWL